MKAAVHEKLMHTSDEVATSIRKFFNMPLDMPLSPDKLKDIINTIEQHKGFSISEDDKKRLTLKKSGSIEITYSNKEQEYEKFMYVLKSFCYSMIHYDFDIKEDKNISEQEILNDIKTRYLVDALILPDAFFREEICKRSDIKGRVNIHGMAKDLKLPFTRIIRRGNAMNIWSNK